MTVHPRPKTQLTCVPQLEEIIQYTFKNKDYAWEALQAKGCGGYMEGNKRLALLGDAVLKTKILSKWYPTAAVTETGNNLVQQTAQNINLTAQGRQIGLDKLIVANPSQRLVGVTASQIADAVEAVIGGVFADGGDSALDGVLEKLGLDI